MSDPGPRLRRWPSQFGSRAPARSPSLPGHLRSWRRHSSRHAGKRHAGDCCRCRCRRQYSAPVRFRGATLLERGSATNSVRAVDRATDLAGCREAWASASWLVLVGLARDHFERCQRPQRLFELLARPRRPRPIDQRHARLLPAPIRVVAEQEVGSASGGAAECAECAESFNRLGSGTGVITPTLILRICSPKK